MSCSMLGCKNRSVKGGDIRFFSVPKDVTIANEWLRYCKPTNKIKIENRRVCSEHFAPSAYKCENYMSIGFKKARILKDEAVPTLKLITNDDSDSYDEQPMADQDIKALRKNELETLQSLKMRKLIDTFQDGRITISIDEYNILTSYMDKYFTLKNNLSQIFTPDKIRILMRRMNWPVEFKKKRVKK